MRKQLCILVCVLTLASLTLVSGCGKKDIDDQPFEMEDCYTEESIPDQDDKDFLPEENEQDEEINNVIKPEENKQDSQEIINSMRSVTVYYVDELSAVVVGKKVEIQNEFDIWNELKANGILTEDCKLNCIKINENQTMDLDFNHATAERINSMGTTGETEIIGCIVNTYLEAYDCVGIRLLEEGTDFVSSHGAEFKEYPGRIEFK